MLLASLSIGFTCNGGGRSSLVTARAREPFAKVAPPPAVAAALSADPREFSAVMDAIEGSYDIVEVPFKCGEVCGMGRNAH